MRDSDEGKVDWKKKEHENNGPIKVPQYVRTDHSGSSTCKVTSNWRHFDFLEKDVLKCMRALTACLYSYAFSLLRHPVPWGFPALSRKPHASGFEQVSRKMERKSWRLFFHIIYFRQAQACVTIYKCIDHHCTASSYWQYNSTSHAGPAWQCCKIQKISPLHRQGGEKSLELLVTQNFLNAWCSVHVHTWILHGTWPDSYGSQGQVQHMGRSHVMPLNTFTSLHEQICWANHFPYLKWKWVPPLYRM